MTHDEVVELLGVYALDATDEQEAQEINRHLAECPRCRAELAAHREVAGVLGNLSGSAPAGLWNRIADELAIGSGGPTLAGMARGEMPVGQSSPPAPVIPIDAARPLRALEDRPRAGDARPANGRTALASRRRATLAAIGAVAAVLALVVAVMSSKIVNFDNKVSALSAAVAQGGVEAQVTAAETAPHHVTINLTSSDKWSAKVVALPSGEAFIVPGVMPKLALTQTFQAWAVVGHSYVSLGVLGSSPGDAPVQLEPGMTSILLSTEPRGGTAQPTTSPILQAAVPASL